MDYETFKKALEMDAPLVSFSELQLALWHVARGQWEMAHDLAQANEGIAEFDRLHAYLHRAEGDDWNADYWYRRAGMQRPAKSLDSELDQMIRLWA